MSKEYGLKIDTTYVKLIQWIIKMNSDILMDTNL